MRSCIMQAGKGLLDFFVDIFYVSVNVLITQQVFSEDLFIIDVYP